MTDQSARPVQTVDAPDTARADELLGAAEATGHQSIAAYAAPSTVNIVAFTEAQVNLIAQTICKPKNRAPKESEIALFIAQCKRTGLDPFSGQIYAIFRKDNNAGGAEVMTIQCAIDGFRVIAQRTGHYLGTAATFWCGPGGDWKDVWLPAGNPYACKVVVRRIVGKHVAEVPAVAHWSEYVSNQGLWKKMAANQIAKCAEALALRRAFPNDLSGLYTADEMYQADAPAERHPEIAAPEHHGPEALTDARAKKALKAAEAAYLAIRAIDGTAVLPAQYHAWLIGAQHDHELLDQFVARLREQLAHVKSVAKSQKEGESE